MSRYGVRELFKKKFSVANMFERYNFHKRKAVQESKPFKGHAQESVRNARRRKFSVKRHLFYPTKAYLSQKYSNDDYKGFEKKVDGSETDSMFSRSFKRRRVAKGKGSRGVKSFGKSRKYPSLRRGGFKRFGGFRAKLRYIRRRGGLRRGNLTKFVEKVVSSKMAADQTFQYSYIDYVSIDQTINTAAQQIMWGTNQFKASNVVTVNSVGNLMVMDPFILNAVIGDNFDNVSSPNFTRRLWVKSYEVSARIQNTFSGPLFLTEYRVGARRLQPVIGGKVDNYLINGHLDASIPAQSANSRVTSVTLGATPFDLPRFVKENRVYRVRNKLLKPSEYWTVSYRVRPNRALELNELYDLSTGSGIGSLLSARKGDRWSVFRMNPGFAGATQGMPSTGFDKGVCGASVGIQYFIKVHYTWISTNLRTTSSYQYVPGIPDADAAIAEPAFVQTAIAQSSAGTGAGPEPQSLVV